MNRDWAGVRIACATTTAAAARKDWSRAIGLAPVGRAPIGHARIGHAPVVVHEARASRRNGTTNASTIAIAQNTSVSGSSWSDSLIASRTMSGGWMTSNVYE